MRKEQGKVPYKQDRQTYRTRARPRDIGREEDAQQSNQPRGGAPERETTKHVQ